MTRPATQDRWHDIRQRLAAFLRMAWLPRFRDGSVIRFTGQRDALDESAADWGPMRIVYLQYASDPITFFDPHSAWRSPA